MVSRQRHERQLVEILSGIAFDTRYLGCYRVMRDRARTAPAPLGAKHLQLSLSRTGVDFRRFGKKTVFRHAERHEQCELTLDVAFSGSFADFDLAVKTQDGVVGGPYRRLARMSAILRDATFVRVPTPPRLPFANERQLDDVVRFGVGLFEDAKQAILRFDGWAA